MKKSERVFFQTILALVPVLPTTLRFSTALTVAWVLAAAFLGTALWFRWTWNGFPERVRDLAVILWVGVWGEIACQFFHLSVFWPASFYLLWIFFLRAKILPLKNAGGKSDKLRKKNAARRWGLWSLGLLRRAFLCVGLMLFLGLSQEILGERLGCGIFQHPSGAFLLLALAWVARFSTKAVRA